MHKVHSCIFYSDPLRAVSNEVISNNTLDKHFKLEVNIVNSSLLLTYMDRLVWYYNEYPILTSSINSLEQSKSYNVSFQNGGEYRVRYEGFLTVPSSIKCEHSLLEALQYYPTFRQVVFNSKKKGNILLIVDFYDF